LLLLDLAAAPALKQAFINGKTFLSSRHV